MSGGATPEDTGLAHERTALAWRRTALSFAVAGSVLLRLLHGADPALLVLSASLVVLGCVAWLWAWHGSPFRPAVDSRLGRAAVRTIAIGTGTVAVAAIVVRVLARGG